MNRIILLVMGVGFIVWCAYFLIELRGLIRKNKRDAEDVRKAARDLRAAEDAHLVAKTREDVYKEVNAWLERYIKTIEETFANR